MNVAFALYWRYVFACLVCLYVLFIVANITNFIFLSILGKQEDIFDYLLETFNENPEQKKTDFYIFFMIRSGRINQLISEHSDYLFQKFYYLFVILIENLDYFYDMNVILFFEIMLKKDSVYVRSIFLILYRKLLTFIWFSN